MMTFRPAMADVVVFKSLSIGGIVFEERRRGRVCLSQVQCSREAVGSCSCGRVKLGPPFPAFAFHRGLETTRECTSINHHLTSLLLHPYLTAPPIPSPTCSGTTTTTTPSPCMSLNSNKTVR